MATASDGPSSDSNSNELQLEGGFMKEQDEQKEREIHQQHIDTATHSIDSSMEGADTPTPAQTLENSQQQQPIITGATATKTQDSKPSLSVDAHRRRQRTPPAATASSLSKSSSSPPPTPPARLAASSAYSINSNNERRLARRASSGSPSSSSSAASTAINPSTSSSSVSNANSPSKAGYTPSTASASKSASTSPHNVDASTPISTSASSQPNHATQASVSTTQQSQSNGVEAGAVTSSSSTSPSAAVGAAAAVASTSSPSNYASSSSPKQQQEAGSSSPSPSSSSSSSSSSPMQRQPSSRTSSSSRTSHPARRVKVYALHECNWIDLGTGSCTYHRGIIHRKRQRVERPLLKDGSVAPLFHRNPPLGPASELKSISDRSLAEMEEAKAVELGLMDDAKYEWIEEIKLIELESPEEEDDDSDDELHGGEDDEEQEERIDEYGRTVKGKRKSAKTDAFNALDETGEEETAWIEVLKEGRWKTDPPSSTGTLEESDKKDGRKTKSARKKRRREEKELATNEIKLEEGDNPKKRKADDDDSLATSSKKKQATTSNATLSEDSSESSSGEEEKPPSPASSVTESVTPKSDDDEPMIGPKEASPSPSSPPHKHTNRRPSASSYQPKWTMRLEPPEMTGDTVIDREMFHASYFADEGEEIIGRYRRQQDTLIVWKTSFSVAETFGLDPRILGDGEEDGDGWFPPILSSMTEQGDKDKENGASSTAAGAPKQELELALSFAATSACGQVWEWIKAMHLRWLAKWMEENNIALEDGDLDLLDMAGASDHLNGDTDELDEYIAGRNLKLASLSNSSSSASSSSSSSISVSAKQGTLTAARNDPGISTTSAAAAAPYGLGLGFLRENNNNTPLPDPNMINIDEIERHIRAVSRSAAGREKMSSLVVRNEFLPRLFPIFREYEDLESIADLHTITNLVYAIINLNDHTLWEHILDDKIFMDVIDILEYDPEYPTMKANYRAHLSDPNLFVEVVPIPDPTVKTKIHQIYRLQYLKDVILARILEDSAFSSINSFIYFHQVDIVQYLNGSAGFWKQLFGDFFSEDQKNTASNGKEVLTNGSQQSRSEKQHDAIAFLQSFCQMVKQLQPIMRTNSFRLLCDKGVLRVINFALSKMAIDDLHIRVATVEIFMLLVDHDTSGIRSFILQENKTKSTDAANKGGKKTLLYLLIDTFHKEEDLGVKAQLSEAIRVLLLPPGDTPATETALQRTRPDPYAEEFLQYFYEHCISHLLEPLLKGLAAPTPASLASSTSTAPAPPTTTPAPLDLQDLTPPALALYTHLCELLCFFVVQHSFRSKFFILSSNISSKVSQLLLAKPKHLRLAALRFFRACKGRNDDFYNRYFVKNNIFKNLVTLAKDVVGNENLLTSACLEFFEFIRVNNVKNVLDSLMSAHEQDMRQLAERDDVFRGLISKWEQNHEPPPREASSSDLPEEQGDATFETSSEIALPSSQPDKGSLDLEEEEYFNAEDDDDEDEITPEPSSGQSLRRSQSSTLLSKFTSGGLLGSNAPPSHAAKNEDDDDSDLLRRKRQKTEEGSVHSGKQETISSIPPDAPSTDPEQELEKIRDKRKRAEDEEDEEDVLAKKKSATSLGNSSISSAGTATAAAKKAPVKNGGKFTLLFGKK